MSQVKVSTIMKDGTKVEILGGWDRPLREFFISVFNTNPPEDSEGIIYSTLGDWNALDRDSTLRLQGKLEKLGVALPDGFWDRVERREGNVTHVHRNGSWEIFAG